MANAPAAMAPNRIDAPTLPTAETTAYSPSSLSHSWSVQGLPAQVKENGSTDGMPWVAM